MKGCGILNMNTLPMNEISRFTNLSFCLFFPSVFLVHKPYTHSMFEHHHFVLQMVV